jgi:DNA-binding GntR family transcriptional regulator
MAETGVGTKADDIAIVLEEAIVSGEIAPGTVLRQEQLSERYQVSRTPVREALRRLAALGLVSFVPNRGVRVRTLSRDELREAFLVRAELESLATELAVPRFGDAELNALDEAAARFARLTEALRGREDEEDRMRLMSEWMRANHGFHDVIYAAADSPLVERLAKSARRSFFGSAAWSPGGPELDARYEQNVREHQAIRDAIAAGSTTGARALAREHVLSSGRLLELILEQMSSQPRSDGRYAAG